MGPVLVLGQERGIEAQTMPRRDWLRLNIGSVAAAAVCDVLEAQQPKKNDPNVLLRKLPNSIPVKDAKGNIVHIPVQKTEKQGSALLVIAVSAVHDVDNPSPELSKIIAQSKLETDQVLLALEQAGIRHIAPEGLTQKIIDEALRVHHINDLSKLPRDRLKQILSFPAAVELVVQGRLRIVVAEDQTKFEDPKNTSENLLVRRVAATEREIASIGIQLQRNEASAVILPWGGGHFYPGEGDNKEPRSVVLHNRAHPRRTCSSVHITPPAAEAYLRAIQWKKLPPVRS